jgi:hypothetical protein
VRNGIILKVVTRERWGKHLGMRVEVCCYGRTAGIREKPSQGSPATLKTKVLQTGSLLPDSQPGRFLISIIVIDPLVFSWFDKILLAMSRVQGSLLC